MASITSDIKLASNALVLLGHEPIASFEESTAGATIANTLYESSYLSLLTSHRWRFATKTQLLSRLSAAPEGNFSYQFQLPSDLLYLIKTDSRSKYEIYGNTLRTNNSTVEIDYIYRVKESQLPAYYIKMVEFFLAMEFALPLTGSLDKGSYYRMMFEAQLKRAKFADSSQRPGDPMRGSDRYTRVRG